MQRGAQALGYVSSGIWGGISAGPVIGNWLGSFAHAAGFQLGAALAAFGLALLVREDFGEVFIPGTGDWLFDSRIADWRRGCKASASSASNICRPPLSF